MRNRIKILSILYLLSYILYSIYSYAFLDVGLTLTSLKPYLEFQKKMRHFGYSNRQFSTIIFTTLSFLLFTFYFLLFNLLKKRKVLLKKIFFLTVFISGILVFSYPAFSYDIFNYIFNTKMVLVYHANPHKVAAWNFSDPMLGFMRNIHTAAPYFYGWTIISFLPSLMSFNRIFPSLINFKLFSLCLFLMSFLFLSKLIKKLKLGDADSRLALFLLNPLILIETIGVGHNDFSMMGSALASFYFLMRFREEKKPKFILYSLLLILFSISTKYATIVLLPVFLIYYFRKDFDIGLWGAILLFLLPLTRPLDQLHSWYLVWPLVWILLSKNKLLINFFYLLSAFALFRYTPYIYYGHWDPPVLVLRLIIYFLIPLIILLSWLLKRFWVKLTQ